MDELAADVCAFLREHPSLRLEPGAHKVRGAGGGGARCARCPRGPPDPLARPPARR